ncbi:MAG: acyloxyacyl hydrolase [Burkholderiaceae bacterium]|nr:acyloxyacyl hydrolase [Burkholderiaceae bacterium]
MTIAGSDGSRHKVHKVELDAGWTQQQPLWQGQNWRLRLRHEAVLGEWRVPEAHNLTELGYSPVFRLERPSASGVFFVEASIGVRLLSHTWLEQDTTLSTAFQFADMAGIGWQWGRQSGAQTVGLRFQHQSNADIKEPNPGINFTMLYYRYSF